MPTTHELEHWAEKKGIKFTPKYPPKTMVAALEKMNKNSASAYGIAGTLVVTTFVWSIMMSRGIFARNYFLFPHFL